MNRTSFILLIFMVACTPRYIKQYENDLMEKPQTQAEIDRNKILDHAIENELDLLSTESGIYYQIERPGEGSARPDLSSTVKAHYRGTLLEGEQFDSSYDRNEPLEFKLEQVVQGWQEAIPLLGKGGKGLFFIPSGLAYGNRSVGPIPPNSVLVFEIELLDF